MADYAQKSTVAQIRQRFDNDVERFSNLQTGQSSTVDAPLVLDLIIEAAASNNPDATASLDIGCGAGNYTLRLLQALPGLDVTMLDLSQPMLDRAKSRVSQANVGTITTHQSDIREIELGEEAYDVIMAAAVLHHLREDAEWEAVFAKLYRALKPGGSFWISDLIEHSTSHIQAMMWRRYGDYLTDLKDEAYRDHVYAYVAQEDSPRPIMYQLDLLRQVGFRAVEILHKNSSFAAFGGIK